MKTQKHYVWLVIAVVLAFTFSNCVKDPCENQVTLLPEGIVKALENEDSITYLLEWMEDGRLITDTIPMWPYEQNLEFKVHTFPFSDCSEYEEMHYTRFLSYNHGYALDYTMRALNEDEISIYLVFKSFGPLFELEEQPFAFNGGERSQVYSINKEGVLRYSLDSGLVSASNEAFTLKRIQ